MPVIALTASLAFVVLFWRLGTPTFWDPDEAHYAETSREMVQTGDWWAPQFNGQPFFDKPALFHQLQAAVIAVAGPSEFSARFIPALAALGLVLMTYWFARVMLTPSIALVAALLLLVNPGVFALARYAILDTLFTFFTFGGAAVLVVAALKQRSRLQWLGYVLIAGGVATKGPIAIVLCGLTMVIAIAWSSELRARLLRLHWILGLVIVVACSSPWFIYMYLRFGRAFIDGYALDENVRLFASSRFENQPGPWFYFQILATALLPWTGVVIGRFVDDARALARGERLDHLEILIWSWTAAVVGFFSASTFKLDHYVFPVAPALALLCARAWVDMWNDVTLRHAATRLGGRLVGPLLVIMGVGCGYFLIARLELPPRAMIVPVVITLCGFALTTFANVRRRLALNQPRVPWFSLTAFGVTYFGLVAFALPAIEQHKVVPDVARWVASHATLGDRVATFRMNRWTSNFRYYIDRPMVVLEGPVEAEAFFNTPQPFYCVMRRAAYDEFIARGAPLTLLYQRDGMWATSGRVLWRRRQRPEQFVVVSGREINPPGRPQ